MGKRTLLSFVTHEEACEFDLLEAKKTTPSRRMEILAHLIDLQKTLPKSVAEAHDNVPTVRRKA